MTAQWRLPGRTAGDARPAERDAARGPDARLPGVVEGGRHALPVPRRRARHRLHARSRQHRVPDRPARVRAAQESARAARQRPPRWSTSSFSCSILQLLYITV